MTSSLSQSRSSSGSAMTDVIVLLGAFTLLCLVGVPIAYALGLAAMVGAFWIDIPLEAVMLKISDGVSKVSMLTIPFFVLAGALEQTLSVAVLGVGAWLVMTQEGFTIGMLVAFQMFAGRLAQPALRLAGRRGPEPRVTRRPGSSGRARSRRAGHLRRPCPRNSV